jgi:hypothetical protein
MHDHSSNAVNLFRREKFYVQFVLALVSPPQVSQGRDGGIVVRWRSQGNGRGVFGYRVQFRTQDSGWNPYGYVYHRL